MLLSDIPISAIRAFEAAARTGSFRDAANELHLTPSAVSHAIRKLESTMSTTLFERGVRSVRLTPAGQNLMRHAGAAFDNLRRGIEEVSGRGPQLLRVHCAPSFAAQWLAPRLKRFIAAEPRLEVRLAASTEYARFSNDDFDLDMASPGARASKSSRLPRRPSRRFARPKSRREFASRKTCSTRF
jgi:LysR family transcriptional regulator, glycine cleavage system transcriptional activator